MSSFTQNESLQQEREQGEPSFQSWQDTSYLQPGEYGPSRSDDDPVELRTVLLLRAIENEIIPRLMLAHRNPQECLLPPAMPSAAIGPEDVTAFSRLVLAPDENLARACIDLMRTRGSSVEAIYVDLLAPVARHLGELWEEDLCDFTDVTMGLGRLQQILRELSGGLAEGGRQATEGRRILLLPCPGEQHTFGLVMVGEFFRRAGWDVSGGPAEIKVDAAALVQREHFDVIGLSLAGDTHLSELGLCVRAVRHQSLNPDIVVLVGGPAFVSHPEYLEQIQADAFAVDGRQAPGMADELVARARHVRLGQSRTAS